MEKDLNQIVSQIMANPEFGNLVKELKQSNAASSGENGSTVPTDEVMKKLPEVMQMLGMGQSQPSSAQPEAPAESSGAGEEQVKIDRALKAIKKMDSQKCERLLGALKPYVNKERGEVIDKAVSVMKITDILGAIQAVDPTSGGSGAKS